MLNCITRARRELCLQPPQWSKWSLKLPVLTHQIRFYLGCKDRWNSQNQETHLSNHSYEASSQSWQKIKGNGQASSHSIIVRGADDFEDKTKSAEALETSENGEGFQHGPVNDRILKHYFRWRQLLEPAPQYEPKLFMKRNLNSWPAWL